MSVRYSGVDREKLGSRVDLDSLKLSRIEDPLHEAARSNGAKVAVIDGDSEIGYASLEAQAIDFATGLQALGLAPGDRVSIFLDKTIQSIVALYGTWIAGGVAVPVNDGLKPRQVRHIVSDSGSRFLVSKPHMTSDLDVSGLEGVELLDVAAVSPPPGQALSPPADTPDGRAAILYSSGSTGLPKGILLSHANLLAGSRIVARYLEMKRDDTLISLVPFSFDYGLNQLLSAVYVSALLVLQRSLFPADICRTLTTHEITGMAAVPALWMQLLQGHSPFARMTFPHLRYITNTGGAFPVSAVKRYREILPQAKIYLMYGLSESFRSSYLPPEEVDRHPDSIGRAIPECELFVLSEDGRICEPGEVGELVHRGPTVALGYWNNPEATARVFRPDPFTPADSADSADSADTAKRVVYSGDLVKTDETGRLYFVSRRDQMIKSSGFRISPDEVEQIVLDSKMVNEVVVKGIPDPVAGSAIAVHCVPVCKADFSEADFLQYCRAEMPRYMVPKQVHLHSTFPRTASGKIDRTKVGA